MSPHLERTRAHVVDWARAMGMLDSVVWDQRRLVGFDLGHCGAMLTADGDADTVDLWSRTAWTMPPPARAEFRTAVEAMAGSWLWELAQQRPQPHP